MGEKEYVFVLFIIYVVYYFSRFKPEAYSECD